MGTGNGDGLVHAGPDTGPRRKLHQKVRVVEIDGITAGDDVVVVPGRGGVLVGPVGEIEEGEVNGLGAGVVDLDEFVAIGTLAELTDQDGVGRRSMYGAPHPAVPGVKLEGDHVLGLEVDGRIGGVMGVDAPAVGAKLDGIGPAGLRGGDLPGVVCPGYIEEIILIMFGVDGGDKTEGEDPIACDDISPFSIVAHPGSGGGDVPGGIAYCTLKHAHGHPFPGGQPAVACCTLRRRPPSAAQIAVVIVKADR